MLPIFPVVGAMVLPLHIYASNSEYIGSAAELIRPLVAYGLLAAVLTGLSAFLLRSLHRGGWMAALLVLVLFYGGPVGGIGAYLTKGWLGPEIGGGLAIIVVLGLEFLVGFHLRLPLILTRAANAIAAAVLVYNCAVLGAIAFERSTAPTVRPDYGAFLVSDESGSQAERPDIYHVVLDGYSRDDVLRDVYGFDNSVFTGRLKELGFAVADRAVTPYNQTQLVMVSIFQGSYLPNRPVGEEQYRRELFNTLQRNAVMQALRRNGYGLYSVKPQFPLVQLRQVDREFSTRRDTLTFLERAVHGRTGISWITNMLGIFQEVNSESAEAIADGLDASFTRQTPSPFFMYSHLIAPHPPFDRDRDGARRPMAATLDPLADANRFHRGDPARRLEYRDGYLEKLRFINREVLRYLDEVISSRPEPKIIIVHGDHGGGLHFDFGHPAAGCLRERYSPLLAVYSSDGKLQGALPPDLNLVNLYRLVFNEYFDAELNMLPGRSLFADLEDPSRHIAIRPEDLAASCPPATHDN